MTDASRPAEPDLESGGAPAGEPSGIPPELARLRHSIDNIDAALVYLLAERFKATKQVGVLKAQRGLPPSDPGREVRQVARLRELAQQADLDPVFADDLKVGEFFIAIPIALLVLVFVFGTLAFVLPFVFAAAARSVDACRAIVLGWLVFATSCARWRPRSLSTGAGPRSSPSCPSRRTRSSWRKASGAWGSGPATRTETRWRKGG